MKKLPNLLFLVIVLLFLCIGLVRTFFFPREVNEYENRYAYQVVPFSIESATNQQFQDGLEKALSDQIPKAAAMKEMYNAAKANYTKRIMLPILSEHKDRYFNFMGSRVFGGDQLVFETRNLDNLKDSLTAKAENYNKIIEEHPDLSFYSYFIEKDTDIQFETGEKVGAGEFLFDLLNLPPSQKAIFKIDSYEQFRQYFYLTDHHWNCKGSYQGYQEVLDLLDCKDTALVPVEEVLVSHTFKGSKNSAIGASVFSEPFYAYRFDFPDFDITINGESADDYGAQETCLETQPDSITYGTFYGGDLGEVIFETGHPERENILVIGESYDNAILKLLASHYNVTCSVDLRYYEHYMQKPFCFSSYVQEHDIDKVLFIGNIDFYTMSEFALEN